MSDDILAGTESVNAVDRAALEAFAGQADRMRQAREQIDKDGLFITRNGVSVPHPALEIERAASREMRGWEAARPDLFAWRMAMRSTDGGGDDGGDADTSLDDELAQARAARTAHS